MSPYIAVAPHRTCLSSMWISAKPRCSALSDFDSAKISLGMQRDAKDIQRIRLDHINSWYSILSVAPVPASFEGGTFNIFIKSLLE